MASPQNTMLNATKNLKKAMFSNNVLQQDTLNTRLENAKKIADYGSEEEEEISTFDERKILNAVYKHYMSPTENHQLLSKTASFLENVLHSGAATCLICIESVRRADSIWSCQHCFCFFHLNCIKRWANDSVAQLKAKQQQQDQGHYNNLGEFVPPKSVLPLQWCCPQCRAEYTPAACPVVYECFCGKELNPPLQPWLVPHSCGEMCCKQLQPQCGHRCLLLCHPGPCPPCSQYAVTSCLCGYAPSISVRCTNKDFQCAQKCEKSLPCGKHSCNQICHKPGQCPSCRSTSKQPCECGREVKRRSCSDLHWKCQKVCGLTYSCGIHTCKIICHSGACGECPLGLPRSCPCGKTKKVGPCSEVVDTCGDTCQKLLSCGLHTCTQRCHRGSCNLCFVITKKKCRCSKHERELPCSKNFTCESKCKQIRDCGKHACNRKCCDEKCPPCDKICGKPLSCRKHKCHSVCHEGPCYPCEQKSQVNCRCGKTSKNIPCGRERSVRIVCLEPCRILSKCHHPSKHRCHKHECPPCTQQCLQPNDTTKCGHICESKCHFAVKVPRRINAVSNSVWEENKKFEIKTLAHPKCEKAVTVTCIGGHENTELPCWNSKPTSCQRNCNRILYCGNHKCSLLCHVVSDITDMKEQSGCESCKDGCNLPRAAGCIHPCPRPCHLPPCQPCHQIIKTKCHCGLMKVMFKCSQFYNDDIPNAELLKIKECLKSCGNRCLKNFPCGHRCAVACHVGQCPNPESCRKKVRIFCKCKRLKLEISCDKYRAGHTSLSCNEDCVETRTKLEMAQKQEEEKLRLQEVEKNRMEVEQFENKFGKRKHKDRIVVMEKSKNFNWKLIFIYAATTVAVLLAIAAAFYEE